MGAVLYDMEITLRGDSQKAINKAREAIGKENPAIEAALPAVLKEGDDFESSARLEVTLTKSLSSEYHKLLESLCAPYKVKIITKWLCMDEIPWDDIYGEDDEDDTGEG